MKLMVGCDGRDVGSCKLDDLILVRGQDSSKLTHGWHFQAGPGRPGFGDEDLDEC